MLVVSPELQEQQKSLLTSFFIAASLSQHRGLSPLAPYHLWSLQ